MNENPQVCGELFRPIKKNSKPKIMIFSTFIGISGLK